MKAMKKIGALLLAAVLMLALFGGCTASPKEPGGEEKPSKGESLPEKKVKVGLSLYYRSDEYYMDIESCMKEVAEKLGFDLVVQDAGADLSKQIQQIEDFISDGVDAIIMSPVDPTGSAACVDAAKKAGVPIFTYDGVLDDNTDVAAYTTCDFYADGYKTGEWAAKYIEENLGGKANVAILDYPPSPVVCGERANGFEDAVKKLPGVKIVARQDGKATRADGMTVAENILTANQNQVDLFFAINYESGAGAASAIQATNAKGVVVCVAWSKEGLTKLEADDPIMKAYMLGNPMDHTKILYAVKDVLDGKTPEKEVLYSYTVVDRGTLANTVDWKSIVAKRGK